MLFLPLLLRHVVFLMHSRAMHVSHLFTPACSFASCRCSNLLVSLLHLAPRGRTHMVVGWLGNFKLTQMSTLPFHVRVRCCCCPVFSFRCVANSGGAMSITMAFLARFSQHGSSRDVLVFPSFQCWEQIHGVGYGHFLAKPSRSHKSGSSCCWIESVLQFSPCFEGRCHSFL